MTRIVDVETGLYGIPVAEALEDATQSFDELELVVAEVETDAGETGTGFSYTIGEGGEAIRGFVEESLEPHLDGAPAAPRPIHARLRAETTFVGRAGVSELGIAAVDVALWDALGKRAGLPLYELLGARREVVPAYWTDGGWLHFDEDELVANAERIADGGYVGMKMKVGRSHAEDERRVRAVREALPSDRELFLDANCAFTVAEARRLANRLRDVDLAWFEEPLPPNDYAAYADLRDRIDVPIAAGENCYGAREAKALLAADAVDVLQPDACRIGGITPWLAACDAARTWGVPVSPHYVEPLHVHLALAFDNVPYVESHSTVLDEVLESSIERREGGFLPPDDPGHGIEFAGLDRFEK